VVLLSQEDCTLCDQAKEVLSRLKADYPLDVVVLEFYSKEGFELAKRGRIMFPPGVFVDDQPFSYGRLSEGKLRREIQTRLSRTANEDASQHA